MSFPFSFSFPFLPIHIRHFKQEEDPFVSTNELSDEIVRVRCERFERALAFVLKSVGEEPKDKKAARDLAPMQDAVNDKLGQWYMANHGVSAAALIEDMRTVLTAYWRLSSKRLTENVCMSFEAHLLQKFAEEIESMLLTDIQVPHTSSSFLPLTLSASICT